MAVAVGEMVSCSKLGQNLSEMEVRTFVRIQKVIWNQLLASKAEFIQKYAVFSFSCRKPRGEILSACYTLLFRFFSWSFLQPAEASLSSKSVEKRSKKMFPFKFKLSGDNSGVFFGRNVGFVMFVFFGCYGRPLLPLLSQVWEVRSQKKILINSGFVRCR